MRFYDPDHGRILLDGVSIHDLDPSQLRQEISLVPQEPVLFTASIADNLLIARPDASPADLRAALRASAADEFVERLPQGLDTNLVGSGARLSAGERQRLAIARALLREPRLLLLDEITSSLDAASEGLIAQGLKNLMAKRATLVIAHRLVTIRRADLILVMDRGQIIARGKHEDLIQQKGLYAHFVNLQGLDQATPITQ